MRTGYQARSARDELAQATVALYQVFAAPLLGPVQGCPHCVDPARGEDLCRLDRRSASADDLGRFAFKAMTTWSTVDDFKHFLPRLLELLPGLDVELVLGKVGYASFERWPDVEQRAVRRHLRALFVATLEVFPAALRLSVLLRGAQRFEADLAPYTALLVDDVESHALHVASLIVDEEALLLGKDARPSPLRGPVLDLAARVDLEAAFFRGRAPPAAVTGPADPRVGVTQACSRASRRARLATPTWRATSRPSLKTRMVGAPRTPRRAAVAGALSMSSAPTFTTPTCSSARVSTTGASALQGPHHGAVSSSRNGWSDARTVGSKLLSSMGRTFFFMRGEVSTQAELTGVRSGFVET